MLLKMVGVALERRFFCSLVVKQVNEEHLLREAPTVAPVPLDPRHDALFRREKEGSEEEQSYSSGDRAGDGGISQVSCPVT